MKKSTLFLLFFALTFLDNIHAQSHIGFLTDNYSGVHGVISNPASITDSRFKTDINIGGASLFGSNDYFGINILDATKDGYSFDLESKKHPKDANYGALNTDILGPSFMFNLSKNSSIALFTRGRAFVNVNDVNGTSIASIDDDTTDDYTFNEDDINILAHAWAEFGVTYARTILNKKQHVVKAGVSIKYLKGLGSAFALGKDVAIEYDADGTDLGGGETTGSITSSGSLTYARYANFDNEDYDYKTPDNASGFGVDLGFVYEWRPNYTSYKADNSTNYTYKDKNKYKLKIGVSITDIGFVNYKNGVKEAFNIANTNVNEDQFEAAENFSDALNTFYTLTNSATGYKIDLPTALHVNADWSLNEKWYINLNTDFSLMSKNRITANRVANMASVTPRYESKWFSFYMPLSVVQNNGFRVGAGFRAGPLYVGSGSVISAISSDNNREADVYAGLKVPIFQNAPKDKDGDGIIDKLDDCPKEAGPISNNGCPIEDKDEDGVLDDVDECPEVAGPEENKGCPWRDKDEDGVLDKDDNCPEQAGSSINKGCPWPDTDGDGVFDKDDDCVDMAGTLANRGCPEEVVKQMQKTLNDYAKTILFLSGHATIKEESTKVLLDIIGVLKEYPHAKFTIEGHTDSIGSYELNQTLSEKRAHAVKTFLVKNGIDVTRLSAIGYGERRPIATNMYKAGRKQNRRVEINLVK